MFGMFHLIGAARSRAGAGRDGRGGAAPLKQDSAVLFKRRNFQGCRGEIR